jgi:CSLREA domain-containing protein
MKASVGFRRIAPWAAISLLFAAPAPAATINVTTTGDVVAEDGLCSLREAITAVNSQTAGGGAGECPAGDGASDTINLGEGKFRLELEPAGDDSNASGDFDILASVAIVGAGSKTVIENRIGSSGTLGDGDRLFHVDPSNTGLVDTTFQGLQLKGGDASCEGAACVPGAGAIQAVGAGNLVVDNVRFQGNTTACSGAECGEAPDGEGSAAAIVHGILGDLTVTNSAFVRNLATCFGIDCDSGSATIAKLDATFSGDAVTNISDTLF